MTANGHGTIPPNWASDTVGEIFDVVGGGTPATSRVGFWSGNVPWVTSADLGEDYTLAPRKRISEAAIESSATNRVPAGSVVVATRVGLGKVGLASEAICFSQDCQALIFNRRLLEPRYVVLYMAQAVSTFKYIGRGTTISGVTKAQLKGVTFLLPPLPEQSRIVAEIEKQFTRLDAAVAALKRVQANLERYRAAVLKAACEGRLVPTEAELARAEGRDYEPADRLLARILQERRAKWETEQLAKMKPNGKPPTGDTWKAKYEEATAPETGSRPTLPDGWVWAALPQLGSIDRGKSKHRPRDDKRLYGGPYPFIQTSDVKRSGGLIRSHGQTYSETGLAQSHLWPAGTLCITIAANIAETGILSYPACFPDSVVGFMCSLKLVSVEYVEIFLRIAKHELNRLAPATAQKNINLEVLSRIAVALPPLAEQQRIVAEVARRLSITDEIESGIRANLRRAERLRQATLKRACEGKLVSQDPNDEPASVLLERIRAERAQLEAERAQQRRPHPARAKRAATAAAGGSA